VNVIDDRARDLEGCEQRYGRLVDRERAVSNAIGEVAGGLQIDRGVVLFARCARLGRVLVTVRDNLAGVTVRVIAVMASEVKIGEQLDAK